MLFVSPIGRFRPGDRDRDNERPGKRDPITVNEIGQAIATLRAMHGDGEPAWLKRIEAQAKENPEEAAKSLSRFPRIRDMMHARENKPEEFELNTRQSRLMRELLPKVRELKEAQREGDQAKVDELRPQIREYVTKLFQIRMELKELEITKIREKLKRAEQELAEIQADGDSLVDEKMEEIMTGTGPRGPREAGTREGGPREGGERPDRDRSRPDRE